MQLLACYDVQPNDKLELFIDTEDLEVPGESELEFTDYAKELKKWAIPSGLIHFLLLLSTYAMYLCLLTYCFFHYLYLLVFTSLMLFVFAS
jgi:hypothetical protein